MHKKIIFFLGIIVPLISSAQVIEDFSDGDFLSNPVWEGDTGSWQITSGALNSNAPTTQTQVHLSTPSTITSNANWEFFANPKKGTSSSNYMDIFLMSDSSNLKNTKNGYFVRIGGTLDEVCLYLMQGGVSTKIIDGQDSVTKSSSDNSINVKVKRTSTFEWTLETNYKNAGFTTQGTVTNSVINTSSYFGVVLKYSSTFNTSYFLDDILVGVIPTDLTAPALDSLALISPNQLDLYFSEFLDSNTTNTLLNYSITGQGNPVTAARDNAVFSLVHLGFSSNFNIGNSDLVVKNVKDLAGNTMVQDTMVFVYSIPGIVMAKANSPTLLDVKFSETVQSASSETISNYSVDGGIGNPTSAVKDLSDPSLVHLTFSSSFVITQNYTITINNIQGSNGGTIPSGTQTNFVFANPYKSSIINEIMADPNPTVGLPDFEYLELYNRTGTAINLKDWVLKYGTTSKIIPSVQVDSGGYVILTNPSGIAALTPFGNAVSVTSLPITAFTNGGISLQIIDNYGNLIDSLKYDLTWYKDGAKDDGGWSLELINPASPGGCGPSSNWKASVDPAGGTPGKINSVINLGSDTIAPTVTSLEVGASMVKIYFSEPVDPSISLNKLNYSVSNGIGNPDSVIATSDMVFTIYLPTPLSSSINYTLTFTGFIDCAGNVLTDSTEIITLISLSKYDVMINEIMADPNPVVGLPNAEFVELFNNSGSKINLTGWVLKHGTTSRTIAAGEIDSAGYVILTIPDSAGSFLPFGTTIGVPSLSSTAFTNAGTSIEIFDNSGQKMDSVFYSDAWYKDDLKKAGGWSLELINPNEHSICGLSSNWSASINTAGGTPGKINSVNNNSADTTGPVVTSLSVINADHISVCLSEGIDLSISLNKANYSISNGIGIPDSVVAGNSNCFEIYPGPSLLTGINYTLTLSGFKDCSGNKLNDSTETFEYINLNKYDVVINEIMTDPEPEVDLPKSEFLELFNRTGSVINLAGWVIKHGTTSRTITAGQIAPNGYAILSNPTDAPLFTPFGNNIAVPSLSTTAFTNAGTSIEIFDNNGTKMDSVFYSDKWYKDDSKKDGGWSLELINPQEHGLCILSSNWIASMDPSGGTPGKKNSVYNITPDVTKPTIVSVSVADPKKVSICFSEPIDPLIAGDPLKYFISGGPGSPDSSISSDANCFDLYFSQSLLPSVNYTLTLTGFKDCFGNTLADSTENINYIIPEKFDIVINEIMADPDPVVTLPNVEYVELYNTTNSTLNLKNWTIGFGTTVKPIPDVSIAPAGYLILTGTTGAGLFPGLPVIGVTSFSLTNTEGTIVLRNPAGKLISSIVYSDSWYKDAVKKAGGWSIEQIDPLNPCGDLNNWKASKDIRGGTPGTKNSVDSINPDVVAPSILSAEAVAPNQLLVTFDETMDSLSLTKLTKYFIDQGIGNPVAVEVTGPVFNSALLTLNQTLVPEILYIIYVDSLIDCAGNIRSKDTIMFADYDARLYDVMINEIMPDPDPVVGLPPYEYIELYNKSGFPIALSGWTINAGSSKATISGIVIQPKSYLILTGTNGASYLNSFGNAVGVSGFPSLTNSGQTLVLKNANGAVIHVVSYSDSWYQDAVKENGGWSLEQMDPNNPCGELKNWKASVDPKGGTPGKVNSIFSVNPDLAIPTITGTGIIANNKIRVDFSESIDSVVLKNPLIYEVNKGIGIPVSASLVSVSNKSVYLTLANPLSEKVLYTLTVAAGIKDCAGNTTTVSINTDFAIYITEPGDIVINEIMADESPAVNLPAKEYIELYNKTDFPIDLQGYSLSSGSSEVIFSGLSIKAKSYLALTDLADVPLFSSMGNIAGVNGLPSFTNTGAVLVLRNSASVVISYVEYSDSWYKDAVKKLGGWSLEQIDFNNPCQGRDNWIASEDPDGGTPGAINSVRADNPDVKGPELIRAAPVDSSRIQLFFSERIDSLTLSGNQKYLADNNLGIPVNVLPVAPDFSSVIIRYPVKIEPGIIYTITVSDSIEDCVGNRIIKRTAKFGIGEKVLPGDLVINEVLFNPNEYGADYVELFNRSEKVIDLYDLRLAVISSKTGLIIDMHAVSAYHYSVFPGEYHALTVDPSTVKKQYITLAPDNFVEVDVMPTLGITSGTVLITDKDTVNIDRLDYTDGMHIPVLKSQKGVSLERLDPERKTDDKTNWHSASKASGYGTPAYQNSQVSFASISEESITVSPEIFSPDNDGYNDVVNISYLFDRPGNIATVRIYNQKGRLVRALVNNELLGIEGTMSWDGMNDLKEKTGVGIYVILFEVYDMNGAIGKFKKVCVVAGDLE